MRVWRLVPEQWAGGAFTGEGARLNAGRWNSVGTALVYLSSSLSLAALETLVHADPEDLPDRFSAIPVDIPGALRIEPVDPSSISSDWRRAEPPPALRAFGDDWVKQRHAVLTQVPSVIIPEEHNYLLNPVHPDFGRLKIGAAQPFVFDPRLLHRP
jgi:RES domain-containing protein